MLISIGGWLICFAAGVALQRRLRNPQRASYVLFVPDILAWIDDFVD